MRVFFSLPYMLSIFFKMAQLISLYWPLNFIKRDFFIKHSTRHQKYGQCIQNPTELRVISLKARYSFVLFLAVFKYMYHKTCNTFFQLDLKNCNPKCIKIFQQYFATEASLKTSSISYAISQSMHIVSTAAVRSESEQNLKYFYSRKKSRPTLLFHLLCYNELQMLSKISLNLRL